MSVDDDFGPAMRALTEKQCRFVTVIWSNHYGRADCESEASERTREDTF
jgi:hypothetical protein